MAGTSSGVAAPKSAKRLVYTIVPDPPTEKISSSSTPSRVPSITCTRSTPPRQASIATRSNARASEPRPESSEPASAAAASTVMVENAPESRSAWPPSGRCGRSGATMPGAAAATNSLAARRPVATATARSSLPRL